MANTNPLKCIYCLYERKLRCLSRKGESHRGLCCVRDPLTCMDLSYSHGVENRSLLAAAARLLLLRSSRSCGAQHSTHTHSNVVALGALSDLLLLRLDFLLVEQVSPTRNSKERNIVQEDAKLKFRPLTIESSCCICQFSFEFSVKKRTVRNRVRGKKKENLNDFLHKNIRDFIIDFRENIRQIRFPSSQILIIL